MSDPDLHAMSDDELAAETERRLDILENRYANLLAACDEDSDDICDRGDAELAAWDVWVEAYDLMIARGLVAEARKGGGA